MTKSIEQIKIKLKCPGCGKQISIVWKAKLESVIGVRFAYICIECNKLISITHNEESLELNKLFMGA